MKRTRTVPYPVETGVWRVSDLSTFAQSVPPPHVVRRLRAIAKDREGITGNACPADTWGNIPVPVLVSLADGPWSSQRWHTVYLPDTPRIVEPAEPRGLVPGSRVAPNIPPRTAGELIGDLKRARIAGHVSRDRVRRLRRRTAERRMLARAITRGAHVPSAVV